MNNLRLEKSSANGIQFQNNNNKNWHLEAKTRTLKSGFWKAALRGPEWHLLFPSVSHLLIRFCSLVWGCDWDIILYWTLDSPHWTPEDCPGLDLESLPQLLGLELVLFLSLLALSHFGFLMGPVWAMPVLAVIHPGGGINRVWSQPAWVLCSVHSDILLPRINISLQKGKESWMIFPVCEL